MPNIQHFEIKLVNHFDPEYQITAVSQNASIPDLRKKMCKDCAFERYLVETKRNIRCSYLASLCTFVYMPPCQERCGRLSFKVHS